MMDLVDESQAGVRVGMVQNEEVDLPVCCPQSPPDDLNEQNLGLCRPCQNDAPHIPVETSGQAGDIHDHFDSPSMKLLPDLLPLLPAGERVYVSRCDSRFLELRLQAVCVSTINSKDERRTIFAAFQPG